MTTVRYLWIFPLLTAVLFPATFITTYIISVEEGTIKPLFSYISDTGAYPPSSGIFTLLLGIASTCLGAVVYIRYKQVQSYLYENKSSWMIKLFNILGFILGIFVALGVAMVGSFQETHSYAGHFFGAFLAFLGGAIYLIVQAIFTFKMSDIIGSKCLGCLRFILGIFVLLLFIICFTTGTISIRRYKENGGPDPTRWDKQYGSWELHVISVSAEWAMALLLDLYILSFVPEFRRIGMTRSDYIIETGRA